MESLREHYATRFAPGSPTWRELGQGGSAVQRGRVRVWRLYMAGSALGFQSNRLGVNQVLAVRPGPGGRQRLPPDTLRTARRDVKSASGPSVSSPGAGRRWPYIAEMADIVLGLFAIIAGAVILFAGQFVLRLVIPIWGFFAGFAFGAGLFAGLADERFLGTVLGWISGFVCALIFAVLAYFFYAVAVMLAMAAFGFAIGSGLVVALGIDWNWVAVLVGMAGRRGRWGWWRSSATCPWSSWPWQRHRRGLQRRRRPDAGLRLAQLRRLHPGHVRRRGPEQLALDLRWWCSPWSASSPRPGHG